MKVTLKDISEATGFSISTISRAIRGEGRISEENRKRILASAHKLGYPLPTTGRSIPTNFPVYIALITQFRTGEFYSSFYVGFLEAAKRKNVHIGLFSVKNDLSNVESLMEQLRVLGFSAAVLFVPEMKEEHYRHVLHATPSDFPIISCSNIDNSILDTVTFDAYQGATLVGRHLHELGYKKLGMIEGPTAMPESRFRTNGFQDYVTHVLKGEIVWSFRGDYTLESGTAAFADFHQQENKPEAVFASNDAMAVGFMEAARREGYVLPDDIAVVGYDNLPICETHYPKITSVDTDYSRLGENAIETLLARMESPISHQGIVSLVPVSLAVRRSAMKKS